MAISYKRLWKLLIDKDMWKENLRLAAGLTTTTSAKFWKNETVHWEIILKICKVFDCGINDIMEIVKE